MANSRLEAILNTAAVLFIQQGYSKTQISHIAKAVGVSVGTIYNDFVGKEEIMRFVLKCTIDPNFIHTNFTKPITAEVFEGLEDDIMATFNATTDNFARYLTNNADGYTFEDLISDAFDLLSRYAVGCLFIERNPSDCGELMDFYIQYRKKFFVNMTKYLSLFIEKGVVRPLKNIELSTTLIIEILTWWAMDMRYISFEKWDVPSEVAKEVCMDNIIAAYKR